MLLVKGFYFHLVYFNECDVLNLPTFFYIDSRAEFCDWAF